MWLYCCRCVHGLLHKESVNNHLTAFRQKVKRILEAGTVRVLWICFIITQRQVKDEWNNARREFPLRPVWTQFQSFMRKWHQYLIRFKVRITLLLIVNCTSTAALWISDKILTGKRNRQNKRYARGGCESGGFFTNQMVLLMSYCWSFKKKKTRAANLCMSKWSLALLHWTPNRSQYVYVGKMQDKNICVTTLFINFFFLIKKALVRAL